MAEFDLNNPSSTGNISQDFPQVQDVPFHEEPVHNTYGPLNDLDISPTQEPSVNSNLNGLSGEELRDPNRIQITIADTTKPIVILFGPPSCGKTMTLVRLARYLRSEDYAVNPIRTFRPAYDTYYKEMCDGFNSMITLNDAAESTNAISFMLVEVMKNGTRLCQILEAPGEYYFNPDDPEAPFPAYVNNIINAVNRKIWCIMVEPDWQDTSDRSGYVSRIHFIKRRMRTRDKAIFVFNKIDKTSFVIGPGRVNLPQARKEISYLYPGIFAPFKNEHPITRFFVEWNCDFIPFQTGDYTRATNGVTYQEGPREYPAKLWNTILKHIRG